MGRYITGDFEYKFWFAVQPTSDILAYGYERQDVILANILYSDLNKIKEKVEGYKKDFKRRFKTDYKTFMKKVEKSYQPSKQKERLRLASLIDLGERVIKELKSKKDDLYVEGEC